MTRHSLFRAALARGPALGVWAKLPAVESVELLALAGVDFVIVDLEHAPLSLETACHLIATARLSGVSALVRIPGLDGGLVPRVLDAGAEGIVVPHVDDVTAATRAVEAVRFPPLGRRGVGLTGRAGAWGAIGRAEYLRFGQEEIVLIAQIESLAATESAEAIGRVAGVDALLIGRADLSVSAGLLEDAPEVAVAASRAVAAAGRVPKPVGYAGDAGAAAARAAASGGYAFAVLGNDACLLGQAARSAVRTARTEMAAVPSMSLVNDSTMTRETR